jgi:hypothetical protein
VYYLGGRERKMESLRKGPWPVCLRIPFGVLVRENSLLHDEFQAVVEPAVQEEGLRSVPILRRWYAEEGV